MSLQLRVTDPLGDRVIDLDDRAADRPHVVGFDPRADVPLAAASGASPRHAFLFVHDGQWFIQDARTQAGTFRNGRAVTGPTPVRPGDVVHLGRGAGTPSLAVIAVDVGAAVAVPPPVDDEEAPESSLASAVASRPATSYYVPRRTGPSPAAITATILLALAIVGGGGVWLHSAYLKREEAMRPQVIVVDASPVATTTAPVTRQSATRRVIRIAAVPATAPAEPPPDPRKSEPEWQAVESARYEDPPIAIIKMYDYLERYPESPFKADVERYVEEALDRIWWQRLIELFEERDLASKQVDERKGQLAVTGEGDFKKILETEIEEWQQRRTGADATIAKVMKYQGLGPPNLYDSSALAGLRQQRDATYYAAWKDDVLKTIRRSRGQRLPWRGGR
jgi:hypothetical protein